MVFTTESIAFAIFTGLIAGLASYFGAYTKVKAEMRAATEDLKQSIANISATTLAVELARAEVAASSALAADQRKAIYALAIAMQTLIHSMCWLSWDAKARNTVRGDMAKTYDTEAHKLLPEIFSQLALLKILDVDLHSRSYPHAHRLSSLDVEFGEAIVLSETDVSAASLRMCDLFDDTNELQRDIDILFGGTFRLVGPARATRPLGK
jgi:hypothetical protein